MDRARSTQGPEQNSLTLRTVPPGFTPTLFDGVEGMQSQSRAWDLSFQSGERHPCAFTSQLPEPLEPAAPLVRMPGLKGKGAVVSHSADRLAKAIVLATHSPRDPRTLTQWGQQVGVSRGALRVWCKAADVSARSCLDFLRILRAVVLSSRGKSLKLLSILDVVDQRSLLNLLDRGRIRKAWRTDTPTVEDFIRRQRYLNNRQLLEAVLRHLNEARC